MLLNFKDEDKFPITTLSARGRANIKKMAESNDLLSAMLPVKLDASIERDYSTIFYPGRTSTKANPVSEKYYSDLIRTLAKISWDLNCVFAILRSLAATAGYINNDFANVQQEVDAKKRIYSNQLPDKELVELCKNYALNLSRGHHHVIKPSQKYKDGFDVFYTGIPSHTSLTSSNLLLRPKIGDNSIDPVPGWNYNNNLELHFNKELCTDAKNVAAKILKSILGTDSVLLENSHKRIINILPLDFDFKQFKNLKLKKSDVTIADNYFENIPKNITDHIGKYFSIVVIRDPEPTTVKKHYENLKYPENERKVLDNSEIQTLESLILQPTISFSIAMHLPREMVDFITQTGPGERTSLASLNSWVQIWSRGFLRMPNQGGRVSLKAVPRYVVPPSKTQEIMEVRKELGYYSEAGRTNSDNLFISKYGSLNYCPKAEELITDNAIKYEEVLNNTLEKCFEFGSPLTNLSTLNSAVFSVEAGRRDIEEEVKTLKKQLGAFRGSLQSYNWDYNVILTGDSADPSQLDGIDISGAAIPDDLAVADYLGYNFGSEELQQAKSFAKSVALMFPHTRMAGGMPIEPNHLTGSSFVNLFPPMVGIFQLYNYLLKKDLVPNFATLLKQASDELNITSINSRDTAPYDYQLYQVVNFNTLQPIMKEEETESWHIQSMLTSAMNDAQGTSRSNLFIVVAEENPGASRQAIKEAMLDNDHFFDPGESTLKLADFKRIYNYLGGRVFLKMLQSILKVDNKYLFLVHPEDALVEGPQLPNFDKITSEIMPFVVMLGNYVPDSETIFKRADDQAERNKRNEEIDIENIEVPGTSSKAQFFPHQVKAHQYLRNRPRFAVLDIHPGGGKCVVGSTLVPTSEGLLTLKEMWDFTSADTEISGFREFKTDVFTTEGIVSTDRIYSTFGNTIKIITADGSEIEGLPDHKILCLQDGKLDFVRIDQLSTSVYIPRCIGTWVFNDEYPNTHYENNNPKIKIPETMTPQLGLLMGLVVSECIISGDKIKIFSKKPEITGLIHNLSDSLFKNGDNSVIVEYELEFSDFLIKHLYQNNQPCIPLLIRRSPENVQRQFLSGLLESAKIKGYEDDWVILFRSNKEFIFQLKSMLENMGILVNVFSEVYNYVLSINTHSYKEFFKLVNPVGEVTQAKQRIIEEAIFDKYVPTYIPCGDYFKKLCNILLDEGITVGDMYFSDEWVDKIDVKSVIFSASSSSNPDVEFLVSQLKTFIKYDWTLLEKTEYPDNFEKVYDLSVPGPHNYSLNGLMGHNTILILSDVAATFKEARGKGKDLKPLILCPNQLVKNWCEDALKIVNGHWNIIPITTQTFDVWQEDRLEELLRNAPPNTIVVAGLSFLKIRPFQIVIGNYTTQVSAGLEFIKKFGFNYIAIDESHKVKNPSTMVHQSVKQLCTSSNIDYIRLATGTLISNNLPDIVGQAAMFSSQIFRTPSEFEKENQYEVLSLETGKKIKKWRPDTPIRARTKLSTQASVISMKRKEWAFMLPTPVVNFYAFEMEGGSEEPDPTMRRLESLHTELYTAVLQNTIENLKAIQEGSASPGTAITDSDEEDEEDETGGLDITEDESEGKLGEDEIAGMERLLRWYIQRLEILLTDPLNDPMGAELFAKVPGGMNFVTRKVRKCIELIDSHFKSNLWKKGATYSELDLVDWKGKQYIARKQKKDDPVRHKFTSDLPPDEDTDVWKYEPRGKVLVFCRYTRTTNVVFENLPANLKKMARLFTGKEKNKWENLEDFKTSDDVMILVANEQAITEGHNLQMASRIIRMETPWAPGDLEQASSRIFRPDPAAAKLTEDEKGNIKPGELRRDVIYLDWIMTNRVMETAKMGRLIHKMFLKAQFDEQNNPAYKRIMDVDLDIIKMNFDTLNMNYSLGDPPIIDYINSYNVLMAIQAQELAEMRKTSVASMMDLPKLPPPEDFKRLEHVPYVADQNIYDYNDFGLMKASDFFLDPENKQYLDDPRLLIGKYAHTEFGNGEIISLTVRWTTLPDGRKVINRFNPIRKIKVKLLHGPNVEEDFYNASPRHIYIATNLTDENISSFIGKKKIATKKDKTRVEELDEKEEKLIKEEEEKKRRQQEKDREKIKKIKEAKRPTQVVEIEEEETEEEVEVAVYPVIYNNHLCVEAVTQAPEEKLLKSLKFKHFGNYAYIIIKNLKMFDKALDFIYDKFEISKATEKRLELIYESFEEGRGKKFVHTLAPMNELPHFFKIQHKKSAPKEIKIYPLILGTTLMLTVDMATNPVIKKWIGKPIPGTTIKWNEADDLEIYFATSKQDAWNKIKELKKEVSVVNEQEFKDELKALQFRAKRS